MKKDNIKNTLKHQLNKEDYKKILLYMSAFFIPVIILIGILAYLEVYPFGDNTYLVVDSAGQYVSYLQYFRDIFYKGNSIFYSLSKSIGGEMYGLFAYYLASPYNLITLLFDKANMPFAFVLILILKAGSCGATFLYYLNRRKKPNFSNLIFSTMYAMSAYVIMYGFNIMWLDAVILLPIVMAGIDDIVKHKKITLYTVSLALTLITNYYIGFMVCIFSAIYFAYKMLLRRIKPLKQFFKKIGIFLLCSIIAVLISGIILLPVFYGIQDGRASFTLDRFNLDKNFKIQDSISKFFTNAFDFEDIKNDATPPVFCGVLANLLVLLYFLNKKISIKEKILSIIVIAIFILSFYINGANLVWTMGNVPAWYRYRYAFAFAFMYILFAKREFDNFKKGTRIWNIIIAILIYQGISIFISHFDYSFLDKNSIKIDMILVLGFSLLLILSRIKLKNKRKICKCYLPIIIFMIFVLNLVNLTCNEYTTMKILREKGSTVKQTMYSFFTNKYNDVINNLKNYDNNTYRIVKEAKINTNDPLTFGYYGVDLSTSTYSSDLYNFLNKLGLEQYHASVKSTENTTKTVNMLLGIKYIISYDKEKEYYNKEYEEDNLMIYSNPLTLSMGYTVNDDIMNVDIDKNNTFYLQNAILKSMTGIDKDVYIKHNGKATKITENLKDNKKEDKDKEAKVIYDIEVENENDLYIYFLKNQRGEAEVFVNGEKKINLDTSKNEMLNLGKRKIGEKIKVEIIANEEELATNLLYVYYEDESVLKEHYEKLKEEQADLKVIDNTHYECKINMKNDDKYLLLTIPYSESWRITVDGTPAKAQKALGTLTVIKLDSGTHSVQLTYTDSKLIIGLFSSIVGIICFSAMIFLKRRK